MRRRGGELLANALALFITILIMAQDLTATEVFSTVRRQPVALALSKDGGRLFVANRASGSVSVIDVGARKVIAEAAVGDRLEDIADLGDGGHLLAIDGGRNLLLLLRSRGDTVERRMAIELPVDPARLSVSTAPGETTVAITSRWGNRLSIVGIQHVNDPLTPKLVHQRTFNLPFSPRAVLWLNDHRSLVAADAFGGRIVVIDAIRGEILSVRSIPAHNITSMILDNSRNHVIITQQFLNHRSETTADSIHWGFLLTNSVRSIKVADLLDPSKDLGAGSHLAHIGTPGHGGGDPTGLAILPNDDVLTTLAGVNEVAIGRSDAPDRSRISVGTRPTAVLLSADSRIAFVANTLDDTISLVDWNAKQSETLCLGPKPPLLQIDVGERLFFNARLSHEGWMSCQSCHGDGHTNGRLADTLGDGSFGAPKIVLSLLGVAETAPYAWNGGIPSLEIQVRKSINTTLRTSEATDDQVRALSTYLQTLKPAPKSLMTDLDPEAMARGQAIFNDRKCERCHTPPTYTSPKVYDVGLRDEVNSRGFNPPSLRGAERRRPYLHDGRARTLDEVFTRFGHPNGSVYTDQEAMDLSMFVRSL